MEQLDLNDNHATRHDMSADVSLNDRVSCTVLLVKKGGRAEAEDPTRSRLEALTLSLTGLEIEMASNSVLYRCSLISFQYTGAATVIVGRRTVAISGNGFRACTSIRLSRNCCSCSNPNPNDTAFVVADDEKYGNKQIISLTPRLYDYILSNVREPEILRQLREETASMRGSQMQVSPDQAQLLAMLVQILGAKRCIELGVYTGYSSLAVALVLPDSACLVACERDAKSLEVAKKYYELAGVSHKVDVKHGMAADVLNSLILNGESCSYDFAFVDAEKRMNQEYFELLLQLVRVDGVIVVDNVLWHGKVADPLINDAKTASIRSFNKNIMEDPRVSISMVPVGDGMTICRKR